MKPLFLIAIILCCSCASKRNTIATTQTVILKDTVFNDEYGTRMFNPRLGHFIPTNN